MKPDSVLREDISIDLLDPNPHNPNVMSAKSFNLLVDNIARMGFTDAVLVKKHVIAGQVRYRIIGGHHRVEAGKVLGYTKVPCTIVTDEEFTEDEENFQLMRHNMIRGKLNGEKFVALYESLQQKYSKEALVEAFGFEERAELDKLIKSTEKSLPPEVKAKFQEGVKEVKTIKDLSNLLNKLFSTHGDTLPYGYMFLDFGGKESVWLRMMQQDMKNFRAVAQMCVDNKRSVDAVMRLVLQLIAEGELPQVTKALEFLPEVQMPTKPVEVPTEELLSMLPQD
jgi:hypothetical protein